MKKRNLIYGVLVMLFAFVLNSCKEDCPTCQDPSNPDCENYDPCYGKDTINTIFKVRPGDRGFGPPEEWCDLIACDTFNASSVLFDIPDCNPENSTYEWQIGSEAETRKGKGFEVDFSDYLRDYGWETWIPITLTVRTPMNECLKSEEETVKTVTRELFFTENRLWIIKEGETTAFYKGYFSDKPEEEVLVTFVLINSGSFRNENPPVLLEIGTPLADTFYRPGNCISDYCGNFRHIKQTVYTHLNNCREKYAFDVKENEWIFLNGTQRIKRTWLVENSAYIRKYEFIGERVE
jgi:hypothetical protein